MTNDIDYSGLGKRIKRHRLKAHLTQERLAEKIDVATSTIAHAENGTSKPSLPLLLKVANALNVTLDQLVCDSLTVVDTYIEKDIAELFVDCTTAEKLILRDIITATKEAIRNHK